MDNVLDFVALQMNLYRPNFSKEYEHAMNLPEYDIQLQIIFNNPILVSKMIFRVFELRTISQNAPSFCQNAFPRKIKEVSLKNFDPTLNRTLDQKVSLHMHDLCTQFSVTNLSFFYRG